MRTVLTISCGVVLALTAFGCGSGTPDPEIEAVKKAVLEPQEAGWARHDYDAYMPQWADDAQLVIARGEAESKYDVVFDRKTIANTRRLMFFSKASADTKMSFSDVKVTLDGDKAELRCVTLLTFGDGFEKSQEIYRLRKTPRGWRVFLNRGWLIERKYDAAETLDAARWAALDKEADELVRGDERGERAGQAMMSAFRFKEAYDLLKKKTPGTGTPRERAQMWIQLGHAAMAIGEDSEARGAFDRALELDPAAAVPAFVHELRKR